MSWDQVSGLLRQILPFVGGFAVARGWINAEQLAGIVGAIITVAGVLWSIKANTQASIVASATNDANTTATVTAVNSLPSVKGVVTSATAAGRALEFSINSQSVATAGTAAAATIASNQTAHGGHP